MKASSLGWVMVALGVLASTNDAARGQTRTAQAMAPFQGSGEVFVVAPEKLVILANFAGILYVQGEPSPLDGAVMLCPVVQTLDTKSKRAEANGHCTFADAADDVVYSTLTCTGGHGSCEGQLVLTGGTGKFAGITGGGKLTVRAALTETAASLSTSGGLVSGATGVTVWPELKYTIPAR